MNLGYSRIQLLLDQKRWELARSELEAMLERSPDDFLAHALLALCLSEQHKPKRALVHARLAVGLSPDIAFAHYIHSIVLQELGQLKEARQSILQALELNPEDPDFYARLGLIDLLEARWQEALNCAEQGLQLDPEHIDCQNLRSMALIRLGLPESALGQLDQALLKEPENARVHANRGWTLLQAGQHQEAMLAFSEALRLEPGLEWAREGLLEAMKARYWLYRQFQRYSFWMSRYGRRHQFLIMLGLILVMRVVVGIAGSASAFLGGLFVLAYAGFVSMTWLADPLFNLLLLFHPFGRYVLAPHERRGAIWLGSLMSGGILAIALGLIFNQIALAFGGLLSLSLLLPTAGTFTPSDVHIRRWLGIYTLSLAALACMGLIGVTFNLMPMGGIALAIYLLALIAFSWIANWLMMRH